MIRAKSFIRQFEIAFMALSVLFIEHLRLFYIDWRYSCQDTGKIFNSPGLKSGLRHYLF